MRKFEAYWGRGYTKQGKRIVGMGWFTERNGYITENIAKVMALPVGKRVDLSDLSGTHTVKRIR